MKHLARVASWIFGILLMVPGMIRFYTETLFGAPPLPALSNEGYGVVISAFCVGAVIVLVTEVIVNENNRR